jgi:hypothetical protein
MTTSMYELQTDVPESRFGAPAVHGRDRPAEASPDAAGLRQALEQIGADLLAEPLPPELAALAARIGQTALRRR